jgi:hypothetical protein
MHSSAASLVPPATTSPIITDKTTFFMSIASFWVIDALCFMIRIRKDVEEMRMVL